LAPAGSFAFELETSKRIVDLSGEGQERWAQKEMRKRGHGFHGLYLSDIDKSSAA
jgi:hypothetical protein